MECTFENNKRHCNCTYEPCSKKFKCCECLHYHRRNSELPACFFNKEYEQTFDRSLKNFFKMHGR